MTHRRLPVVVLPMPAPVFGAEMEVERDLAYTRSADLQRRLDIYSPTDGEKHPVAIWVHGGGWKRGDKAAVQRKPRAFVDRGFVFVSVNHGFVLEVTVEEMTREIARAIRWTYYPGHQ